MDYQEFNRDTVPREERNFGVIVHVAALAVHIIPFGNILGPLIVYLMKRDDSDFVEACGKNCLNFELSVTLYAAICLVLALVGIGFFLLGALWLFNLICIVIAAVKASEGKVFNYPLAIRFMK